MPTEILGTAFGGVSVYHSLSKPVCMIIVRFCMSVFCFFLRVVSCHQHNVALASDRKEMMVHFLLLELETVGNIRFEEGNTSEPWYPIYVHKICCTNTQHARLLICIVICFLSQVHVLL